jgi:hypothetical protein
MRVEVYFNLHKKLFSVRDCKTGKVFAHSKYVTIRDPKFVVRQSGRKRVLQERKKNVHAFVRGELEDLFCHGLDDLVEAVVHGIPVTYNPYKYSSFVVKDTGEPIDIAKMAVLSKTDAGVTMKVTL